jgi:hypothetical protein
MVVRERESSRVEKGGEEEMVVVMIGVAGKGKKTVEVENKPGGEAL